MLRYVALAALFVVVYLLVLRPVKKLAMTAFRELPGKSAAAQPLPAPGTAGVIQEAGQAPGEGQRANQLKRMLTDKVKAEPAAASRLVESWVREDID
jgi:hypothetical protein